jgi:hypothetical protein
MLAWMSYVIVVSLLLSLAALALERSARVRQKPTRWLWGTSMIASLLVPLVISSVSVQIPRLTGVVDPAIPQRVVALRQMTAMYGPAVRCKRFRQPGRCGLASMYPASDWSVLCSGPSWISARVRSD